MASPRSIEVKVGMLILTAAGLLTAFILVMGGINFQPAYSIFVDFDNPGGLQTGAPVKIAGVKVGKIKEIAFRGGDMKGGKREPLVRLKIDVERRYQSSVHTNSIFYVTTQGVLGEQYLAIDPGSPQKGVLPENSIVKGIDPPRLDLFLAKAYELLDTTMNGIRNNRELISDIATNTAGLLKGLNTTLTDNRERINRTMANLESLTTEANTLTVHARTQYVDNPKIARTIDNIDRLSSDIQKDSGPMLKDARESLANLNRASKVVGGEEEQVKLKKTIEDVAQLAARANATAADAQAIVQHIKKGNGTVGALVMDEAIYDDVQEMVRDLKHNPWKFLWRE